MTRVIHTGDTHLGYQQYHSPARREDFLDAFEQVIDDAVSADVDAVVHAGDLFHDRRPELRDLLGTIRVLRRLSEANIPFLAVVGNHESTRGGQWLDLFENLGLGERLGAEPRTVGDTAFYGLDHVPKSRRADLDYDFEPHDAAHAALVSHGLFTPFAHADWETETVLAESNVDFDAVLLGDNHAPGIETVDGAWVTYCGSTERASAAEEDARGYNLVTFGGTGDGAEGEPPQAADGDLPPVDIRRRTLDTRPFVFVSVELAESEGAERVHEQLRQRDVEGAVVVVEVTGGGDPVTPASIEESLTERGALVARVTDRREQETDAEFDVSFADPDDAVEERVRELGLSSAALDVDETIRASKTADSNVREAVEERVSDLLETDRDAFSPAPDASDADDTEGDIDDGTEDDDVDDGIEDDVDDDTEDDEFGDDTESVDGAAAGDVDVGDVGADDTGDSDDTAGTDDVGDDSTGDAGTTDGQVTMGDF
ncbi:DNA double-strand break repair protein Mre11 [Halobellus limi]|uniref:DNA double-strand break repair protein Mre11 n=1 Tax=Halobellus limi TaxID=699433 RepID=A0A1H5Z1T8_9EURY|nr:DNA double-strand break repair protein Mre11 [Halobellus limi]QCC48270.1 exonuclease SbcCD subunit D [Halobellus limi]SEG29617.1 DNA repair exonuclease SbcCD nuclease subunit [Halobellus limi]